MSRRDLSRHDGFEQVSPEVGELDEGVVDDMMRDDPDEVLSMLADLSGATDARLRALARQLAGRLYLDVARRGPAPRRGIGTMRTQPYRPGAGDLDIDASLDALATRAVAGIDADELRVRDWVKPGTAWCLLVDRSGSMGGKPLATAAIAAASVASAAGGSTRGGSGRGDDFSVIAFGADLVVVKSQDQPKPVELVVNDVLSLRGFGTTNLAAALEQAAVQFRRSRAARQVVVVLSDCRQTAEGDPVEAARRLPEVVVLAPADDSDEASAFASRAGARLATVNGPSDIPDALASVI